MERLKPFFPKSHGKPRVDDRRVLSGIIFINRNGLRWCDGPGSMARSRPLQSLEAVGRHRCLRPDDGGAGLRWRRGDPHGQNAGAAVVGRDGGTSPAEDVVDSLGRDLQRRADRTDRDAFRPFPDDLSALLIGQSATATHVKYTFLFLANFVQARLLPAKAEKASRACTQCIKSASRPISRPLANAARIALNATHPAFPGPRIASYGQRFARPAARLVASVRWPVQPASRRMPHVPRGMRCVSCIADNGACRVPRAIWGLHRADGMTSVVACSVPYVPCAMRHVPRHSARGTPHPVFCLTSSRTGLATQKHLCCIPLFLREVRPHAERKSRGDRGDGPERGSGKTTLSRALISAAVAAGRRVLLIDTDSTGVLATWHRRTEAAGLGSPLLRSATVESVGAVDRRIEQVYAAESADFIFIDTAGVGAEWSDALRHRRWHRRLEHAAFR